MYGTWVMALAPFGGGQPECHRKRHPLALRRSRVGGSHLSGYSGDARRHAGEWKHVRFCE